MTTHKNSDSMERGLTFGANGHRLGGSSTMAQKELCGCVLHYICGVRKQFGPSSKRTKTEPSRNAELIPLPLPLRCNDAHGRTKSGALGFFIVVKEGHFPLVYSVVHGPNLYRKCNRWTRVPLADYAGYMDGIPIMSWHAIG